MTTPAEQYPELNIERLRAYAACWAEDFPAITRLALYLARPEETDDVEPITYVVVAEAPPPTHSDDGAREYHSWAREDCGHIAEAIESVRRANSDTEANSGWLWYWARPGEELNDYLVIPESEVLLFPDKPTAAATRGLVVATPPGTEWKDLRIVIRNNDLTEVLEINGPGGHIGNYDPAELGFKGYRGLGKRWTLFKLLAQRGGDIGSVESVSETKPTIAALRKLMRDVFPGIGGDPLPWQREARGWEAAFKIELSQYIED